jgi:hypothetical protein
MLPLTDIDLRERSAKRARIRLRAAGACEDPNHDPTEDRRTGTLRGHECRPGGSSHPCSVEFDGAATSPLPNHSHPLDELDVFEDKPTDADETRLVRGHLRILGADLTAAMAAVDHDDWAATLRAVRLIQGRAVVTRGLLECLVEPDAAIAEPRLVTMVQSVRRLIVHQDVESLSSDELRARMRAVLQTLDRELKAFLSPPASRPLPASSDE